METTEIPEFLRDIAETQLVKLKAKLPPTPEECFLIFLEMQRFMDVASVHFALGQKNYIPGYQFDVLRWGMNLATSHLLKRLNTPDRVPLIRASDELKEPAIGTLWCYGVIALTRRTADLIQHGYMLAHYEDGVLALRDSGRGPVQFMDHIEQDALTRIEATLTKDVKSSMGWAIVDPESKDDHLAAPGAFWSPHAKVPSAGYTFEELKKRMIPLIRPWRISQADMMGYEALLDVDEHFLRDAFAAMKDFHDAAGVHPGANFGSFSGANLLEVTTALLSFLRKHVVFGVVAREHYPEISFTECFTTWTQRDVLITAVCAATGLSQDTVSAIVKCLTVMPEDSQRLAIQSTPVLPMFIDLGNGMLLRPVSAQLRNPLLSFQAIAQWRNPLTRNAMSAMREGWFRTELYGLFGGSRYICVPGNIVLRRGRQRLTDIDAIVFDRTNGELALFQLKWQDYSTNDIRELGSKASNLASEVDEWAERVLEWIRENSSEDVAKAFRLKLIEPQRITAVFLFAASRAVSRPHGYGFPIKSELISIASWPQLKRMRAQVGPVPHVISTFHERLREEEQLVFNGMTPIPVEVEVPGLKMSFENLWFDMGMPDL